jgi:hypothetical protein
MIGARKLYLAMATAAAVSGAMGLTPLSAAADRPAPKIQVALLLDDSGSMSGLINQAKAQLWKFVNEFATTKKNGKAPMIEVALQLHGGPVRPVSPLTDDLDLISERLFAVQIAGNGTEPCGEAIKTAVEGLAWSPDNGDLKVIFIAGNEPFTQGQVNYAEACKAAITKGIVVNTIHCGSDAEGVSGKWKDGALLADGSYMCIDQNRVVPHIEAPQDAEIATLGADLNTTYIPYGAQGQAGAARQSAQDTNAANLSQGVAVERFVTRANAQYQNAGWDLVDAVQQGRVKIEEVKTEDLPENLRSMTVEQRKTYVAENQTRRVTLQQRINDLNAARQKHIAAEMKKLVEKGEETLDSAMIKTLREQAAKRNFQVQEPAKEASGPGS